MATTTVATAMPAALLDKLLLIPLLGCVLAAALCRAALYPFLTRPTAAAGPAATKTTFLKHVTFTAIRTMLANISTAQEQYLNASTTTESNYLSFARGAGFAPCSEEVLDAGGLKVHWLGSPEAEKCLLYFHGGGYALAATEGHVKWLFHLQRGLEKVTGRSVAVAMVEYSLTPGAQYPVQLREAAQSLEWLVRGEGGGGRSTRTPGDIILAGDSAGGNLALALLSHLLHPHPDRSIPRIDLVNNNNNGKKEPLAGAVLISPWVRFSTTQDASFRRNATWDMIPPAAVERWGEMFLGSNPADAYNEACSADSRWFEGLSSVVSDVLLWGGEKEVLIDSIASFGAALTAAHPKGQVVVEQGAVHVGFIFDSILGYDERGTRKAQGTVLVERWIAGRW